MSGVGYSSSDIRLPISDIRIRETMTHLDILFVGNSHTYLHHMPRMLAGLTAAHRGCSLAVDQCTGKGVSLKWHWQNPATREKITGQPWDYVILQDRSGGPLEDRASFDRHADLLGGAIRNHGAGTLFYMTWAGRDSPENQAALAEAYVDAARRLDAGLAPVGLAWQRSIREKPDLGLYHEDGRHAGPAGAYLAACVFYAVLFNTSPAGLPSRFSIKGKPRVDLDEKSALFLQQIAFRTVQGNKT